LIKAIARPDMDRLPTVRALIIVSILGLAAGFAVMAGWVFSFPLVVTVFPGYAAMTFNTAVCFVLLSALLLFMQLPAKKYQILVLTVFSLAVTGIAAASFAQDVSVTGQVAFMWSSPYPGRMSVNTAICFILFVLSLSGLRTGRRILLSNSQYFLHIITVISGLALVGYLYGLPLFYNSYFDSAMAVSSALLFFLLSLSASLLQPSAGVTALFTGTLIGNVMARRVFLFILGVVVVFGAVRTEARQHNWFSGEMAISFLVICFMGFGLALIWHTAGWLNEFDSRRHDAEEEIIVMNEVLEKRVEERSIKLRRLIEKLRESEIKFRAAFEHSAMGMALVSLKGKWLKVNKRLCDMVGYREQELLSMSFQELTDPDDSTIHDQVVENALRKPETASRIEKRYICKNGTTVWVSINIATVTNKKGGPVYFVSQFEDITERKKAEKHLRDAYKQIQDHVNSIQEIAWKQSHLIRSPLANLMGLVEILKADPAERETLKYVQIELERLDAVILEMAEDACSNGTTGLVARKRCLMLPGNKAPAYT